MNFNLLFAFFLAAGLSAIAYTRLGRRIGYGNSQGVWKTVGIIFVIGLFFFYSLFAWVLHFH